MHLGRHTHSQIQQTHLDSTQKRNIILLKFSFFQVSKNKRHLIELTILKKFNNKTEKALNLGKRSGFSLEISHYLAV